MAIPVKVVKHNAMGLLIQFEGPIYNTVSFYRSNSNHACKNFGGILAHQEFAEVKI